MTITHIVVLSVSLLCIGFVLYNTYTRATSPHFVPDKSITEHTGYERIVLAGGCFWCTESEYTHVTGVVSAISGYTDSEKESPRYEEVSSEQVKARESVEVTFDPQRVSLDHILELYFRHIDPTDGKGQFADRGYQYSPAIYYTSETQKASSLAMITVIEKTGKFKAPVRVEVLPFKNFYPAEEYHQRYKEKNPLRYNLYREASGRNTFIKNNWADDSTFIQEIFGTHTTMQEKNIWKNFDDTKKSEVIQKLDRLQYSVTQENGTERPYSNDTHTAEDRGIYVDVVSGEPLFLSTDKYDSGTGWPSFVQPIAKEVITLHVDKGLLYTRTEVRSAIADSHLGHVFEDGPADRGGKRYCMNGAALRFVPLEEMEREGYGEYIGRV